MLNARSLPQIARLALLACLFAAAPARGPAMAAEDDAKAFQKALHAQNAAHLAAVYPSLPTSQGTVVEGTYSDPGGKGPWEYKAGDFSIFVEMKRTAPIDLSSFPVPVLTLSIGGKKMITAEGTEAHADFSSFLFQVAELDPDNPHPEIVFSNYTGGAHCCSDTQVLTSSKDGKTWSKVDVGYFDGELVTASDVNEDSRFEFVVRDNRFLYRFGCYACSAAPLQILQLQGGKMVDVSGDEAYRDTHEESLVRMVQDYAAGPDESNGFLAGYVAQKLRLGEVRPAWDFMMKYHDRKSDWGLSECTKPLNDKNECPGKTIRHTFPEALERFLVESGYPLTK